jgi:hypothetical protein
MPDRAWIYDAHSGRRERKSRNVRCVVCYDHKHQREPHCSRVGIGDKAVPYLLARIHIWGRNHRIAQIAPCEANHRAGRFDRGAGPRNMH